jgi:signal transduction histidine kinase
VAALNWLSEELAKELAIKAEVRASALPPLPPDTELVMFRIAQEALNNIRKHSEASDISITLELKVNEIKMTVTDNGRGFAISRLTEDLAKEGKLGILGMQERARLIGGRLEISSEPGKGTNVIAKVPV